MRKRSQADLATTNTSYEVEIQMHLPSMKKTYIRFEQVALALMVLLPSVVSAQASQVEPEAEVDEILVTATRSEVKLDELPVSATVLSREDIEQSSAQSLDQLLLTVPGVNLNEPPSFAQHPTSNSVSLRGLGGYRTLVLLDGVPLNHAFSGYVQWNLVPLDAIERVEVVRGGASSLWGNYALTGVINIITRVPKTTGVSVNASYGSNNTSQLGASGDWVVNDWLKLGLRGDRFDTDGYNTTPKDQRRPLDINTTFRQNNLQGTALLAPSDTLSGYLRANYHDNQQVLTTAKSTNEQHDGGITGGLTRHLANSSRIEWNGWCQHSRFITRNTATPENGESGVDEFVQNIHTTPVNDTGTSLQWIQSYSGRISQLQLGTDLRRISGRDTADIYDESETYVRTDLGSGKQQFVGVFAQLTATPLPVPLEATLSARYDNFRNYDGFDGNPGGSGPQPNRTKNSFDPRLALRYTLSETVSLRGAAYRAFRAPNLDSLYRGYSTTTGTFLPNSQLGPETLIGTEFGADLKIAALTSAITVFRNDIDNLIGSRNLEDSELPPGFFFGSRNINVGKVRAQGLEFSNSYRFSSMLKADLSYTYTDSRVRENELDPTSVGKRTVNVPLNTVSADLHWIVNPDWNLALQTRYVGTSYGDFGAKLKQDPHVVTDLYSDYRINGTFQLFGSVANLFDRKYVGTNSGYEPPKLGPPAQFFAGIRARW